MNQNKTAENKMEKRYLGKNEKGEEIFSFRIPNSTDDCLEISNWGCAIQSIAVHDKARVLHELVSREEGAGGLFGVFGGLAQAHPGKGYSLGDTAKQDLSERALRDKVYPSGHSVMHAPLERALRGKVYPSGHPVMHAPLERALRDKVYPSGHPVMHAPLERALRDKVWEIAEEGDNYVFFACTCDADETGLGCSVKAGARVMWVNLNRLVVDLYLTPEAELSVKWRNELHLCPGKPEGAWRIRTFAPKADGQPVEETSYANQAFGELAIGETAVFSRQQEEITPMAEAVEENSGLMVSVYTTFSESCVTQKQESLLLAQSTEVELKAGESFCGRVIYGFDYRGTGAEEEFNPLMAFLM